jgi:hypothetical protein
MCAVIKRGILGGFQNKIANVVGGSWKGISYMRSLPISVSNPQTSAQTAQRDKFGAAVAFAVTILAQVIKPLWDRFAQYQSGYNAFVSANIDAFEGGGLSGAADLIISKGTLAGLNMLSATVDLSAHTLVVVWDPNPSGDANADDTVYLVLYNTVSEESQGFNTGVSRSAGTATVDWDITGAVGNSCYIYGACRKLDGTKASSSDFIVSSIVA